MSLDISLSRFLSPSLPLSLSIFLQSPSLALSRSLSSYHLLSFYIPLSHPISLPPSPYSFRPPLSRSLSSFPPFRLCFSVYGIDTLEPIQKIFIFSRRFFLFFYLTFFRSFFRSFFLSSFFSFSFFLSSFLSFFLPFFLSSFLPSSLIRALSQSRPWICYWILHALYLLDREPVHLYPNMIDTIRAMRSRPLHEGEVQRHQQRLNNGQNNGQTSCQKEGQKEGQKESWGSAYGGGPNQLAHG